ncbi:flagellar basal body P-ring formation chaperone FlgA [Pseudooceanicola sp.]|uniref:flagellar basal body P-ring formation chaperone FlgA n=1 Tax=Pseudooceanicola sp. TaxID=1914328 RepID=UPI004058613F
MLRPALLLIALLLPGLLSAATPEVLVEERARELWGPQLPEGANVRVRLSDRSLPEAVMLSAFWMDRDTGRFLANAVTDDGRTTRIEGLALATLDVPVPARRLMPGEIIGESDLQTVELPVRRVGSYTLTAPEDLIGMEVRRMLAQGHQVMAQSVISPLVIDRGEKVTIQYDDGRLVLNAPGRAMNDAHEGQEITVVNLVSNKTLRAVARGAGLVEVIR